MKVLAVVLFSILAAGVAYESEDHKTCYDGVLEVCSDNKGDLSDDKLCGAKYGGANSVMFDLQSFANDHIARSFQYLLMATHFDNYEKNREGFTKLFRKLSDTAWEDGIKLMKYITERGGQMIFTARKHDKLVEKENSKYELNELASLSRALDIEKSLAGEAFHIHGEVLKHQEQHDPEVAAYLEDHFLHREADRIRDIAGHLSDLGHLVEDKNPALAVFLFDEYLKTVV